MKKRLMLAGLFTLPFFVSAAKAAEKNHAVWKVPPGIKKIRVRSWNADGSKDLDRTLTVEPNQTFRIDAIEG